MFVADVVKLCDKRRVAAAAAAWIGSCVVAVLFGAAFVYRRVFLSAMYVWSVGQYCNVTCASDANAGFAAACVYVASVCMAVVVVVMVAVVNVVVVVAAGLLLGCCRVAAAVVVAVVVVVVVIVLIVVVVVVCCWWWWCCCGCSLLLLLLCACVA